jgi:hypothetical protein
MKVLIRLVLAACARARVFFLAHPDPNSASAQVISRFIELLARGEALAQLHRASQVAGTAAVNLKNELREAIETDFRSLAGLSHGIALTHPEMTVHVRLPRGGRVAEATFLTVARVAVDGGLPNKELFVANGMPETLLEKMTKDLNEYEAALTRQRNALSTQVGANAQLAAVTTDLVALLKHLDSVVRLRFGKDLEMMAAWKSARNVAWPEPHEAITPAPEGTDTTPPPATGTTPPATTPPGTTEAA